VKLRGAMVPFFHSDPDIFRRAYLDPPEAQMKQTQRVARKNRTPHRNELIGHFAG